MIGHGASILSEEMTLIMSSIHISARSPKAASLSEFFRPNQKRPQKKERVTKVKKAGVAKVALWNFWIMAKVRYVTLQCMKATSLRVDTHIWRYILRLF